MKLRTSFFNGTILRKDLTRFAPLWGLYTILELLFVILLVDQDGYGARFASNGASILRIMGVVNIAYGGLCAIMLFGDQFNTRLCNAEHMFPMRREGWFFVHVTAGMLMCLVPNLIGALFACVFLREYAYMAFIWLAVMVLQYLFFFGVGAFSAMCAGNRLGMTAVYGLINLLAVLAAYLVITFYEPVLYGMSIDADNYTVYSPIVRFCRSEYIEASYSSMGETFRIDRFTWEEWRYLLVAAAVGLVFLAGSLLLYRKRDLESAGDFIALRPVAYCFLALYSLGVGALMDLVSGQEYNVFFILVGFAIGFFTGRMLLERKGNVFGLRNLLGFGAFIGLFLLSIGLTWLDPIGVTRYVPEVNAVEGVMICPYTSQYHQNTESVLLTEPEDIAAITYIHKRCTQERPINEGMPLSICYTMQNGAVVERTYSVDPEGEYGKTLRRFYSSEACLYGGNSREAILRGLTAIEFNSEELGLCVFITESSKITEAEFAEKYGYGEEWKVIYLDGSFIESPVAIELFDAIRADCDAGTMAQFYAYHEGQEQLGWMTLRSERWADSYFFYRDIIIYEDCVNTIACLKSLAN